MLEYVWMQSAVYSFILLFILLILSSLSYFHVDTFSCGTFLLSFQEIVIYLYLTV